MSRRLVSAVITFLLAVFLANASYAERRLLEGKDAAVYYDVPLQNAASEVLELYPGIRTQLTGELGWKTDFRPEIVLIKDSASFRKISGSDLIAAFAVPQRDLIVIDYARMNVQPFTLGITLKHELCHLDLHHHIAGGNLPRWFDEGICQWVTGGLSELMAAGNRSTLREAALSNRLISFGELATSFPSDSRDLVLAYEESKSIIEYIKKEYGVSGVRNILEHMNRGDDLEEAVRASLAISLVELEKRWRESISQKISWFSYIGDNIYEVLFAFAALITVYGFFRVLKKRRDYKDEEDEQDGHEI